MAKKAKKKVSKAKPKVVIEITVDRIETGEALDLAISAIINDPKSFERKIKDIAKSKEEINLVWEALETIYYRTNDFNKQLKEALKFMKKNKAKDNVEVIALQSLMLEQD